MNRKAREMEDKNTERRAKKRIAHEIAAFKNSKQLPVLAPEITKDLISHINRGNEEDRTQIHEDMERTVPEDEKEDRVADAWGPELDKDVVITKEWIIREENRTAIERLEIIDKLSGKNNIAGDVWRAKKFWDDVYYGDIVLKTPKRKLRESRLPGELSNIYKDLKEEEQNLVRFDHPNIVSSSGPTFIYNGEPVIQMEYQAWAFMDYIRYHRSEHELTGTFMSTAIQTLEAVSYLADKGYVHVDIKTDHIRLDAREDAMGETGWFIKIIDLDSIVPSGDINFSKLKYNLSADPEKFMKLHDPSVLITAEPSESVYALAITLLRALSQRMQVGILKRGMKEIRENGKIAGLKQINGNMVLTDEEKLREKIIDIRVTDEIQLLSLYYVNKFRRILAGKFDQDPGSLRELIEKYSKMPEIRERALKTINDPDTDVNVTVHPEVFASLSECIRPYAQRHDPKTMLRIFENRWNEYLTLEEKTEE